MSFPPVVIDTTTTSSPPTPERPVYVYGQSGRCWKFRNAADADAYFDTLTMGKSFPEFLTDVKYLIRRYGESILKRLALISPKYGNLPIITESNFDVDITHKGKRDHAGLDTNPRTYTYYFKKANISITCNKHFSMYSLEPLQYLFPDHKYHRSISCLTSGICNIELLQDYLLGDGVRYTEPRAQVAPQRQPWSFMNIFRSRPSYERIHVDLHLE